MYENTGYDNIAYVILYILDKGEKPNQIQSTYIQYDKTKGVKVNDPNGIFSDAKIELSKMDVFNVMVKFSFAFEKAVGTKSLLIKSWDTKKNANQWSFDDAISVVGGSGDSSISEGGSFVDIKETKNESSQELTKEISQEPAFQDLEEKGIPAWIKTSAKWWNQNEIRDSDFIMGIEYLIQEKIINVPQTEITEKTNSKHIPDWFRNTAGWWQQGNVSDEEFTKSLEWLIAEGVIQV